MNNPLGLQFDEYFRYRAVADLIASLGRGPFRILDVGGGAGRFLAFLPGHDAVSVDKKNGVDGCQLPFGDRSFDIVTSIDVLEHLPVDQRQVFIGEIVRVARLRCFLAFPHAGAAEATRVVNRFCLDWLKEHLDNGLPSAREVEGILEGFGVTYRRHENLPLAEWVAMTVADWYAPDELKRPLNEDFNRLFYREPCGEYYRLIYEIEPQAGRRG